MTSRKRWKVYKQRDGFWAGSWIAQPPNADFGDSFEFRGPRAFDNALNFATQHARAAMDFSRSS